MHCAEEQSGCETEQEGLLHYVAGLKPNWGIISSSESKVNQPHYNLPAVVYRFCILDAGIWAKLRQIEQQVDTRRHADLPMKTQMNQREPT